MTENVVNNIVTCKNCGNKFSGKYCNQCGEKVYTLRDKKVWYLLEEVTHFITHFEGTLLNTFKAVATQPGKLSLDYCNGIRKKYFKPVSFFLLLVVIYLFFPVFESLNQQLVYHLHSLLYGKFAIAKVESLQKSSGMSFNEISEMFHEKGEKISKFLLLILLPFSAIFMQCLLYKKRRLFFDHFIFATEINIFFLLWGFLLFPLLLRLLQYIIIFLFGQPFLFSDWLVGLVIFGVVAIYIIRAAKRFYVLKTGQAILFSIIFMILYFAFIQFIYKFILFIVVFSQMH